MENQLQLIWNHEYKIDGIKYEESLTEIKDIRNTSNNHGSLRDSFSDFECTGM